MKKNIRKHPSPKAKTTGTSARTTVQRLKPTQKRLIAGVDNISLPAVREAYGFKGKASYNPWRGFLEPSGKHIGRGFIKKIERRPSYERSLCNRAKKKYESFLKSLKRLERAVYDSRIPMNKILEMVGKALPQASAAKLDFIFDPETYYETVRRNLKEGSREKAHNSIIGSMIPSNGLDNYLSSKRRALLFLAHELGKKSSHPDSYGFVDFDFNNYRANFVTLKEGSNALDITKAQQRREIERFRTMEGINTFEDALNGLKELHRETMTRKLKHQQVTNDLVNQSMPGKREAVRRLTHFAGEALSMAELVHVYGQKIFNLLVIAAERRKISRREVAKVF